MKRLGELLLIAVLLAFASSTRAETLTAVVPLSPVSEVPPIVGLDASGKVVLNINVLRDAGGAITGGRIAFAASVRFPGSVTITGLHIHEGGPGANGSIIFDSGLSGTNSKVFADGAGAFELEIANVDSQALQRFLRSPAGFYVNLRTSMNTAGAMRGQVVRLTEMMAQTISLSSAEEVPPIVGLNASGAATITLSPTRDARGAINGGTATFTVSYDFPGAVMITGLHIHEAPTGMNGNIVISAGISADAPVASASGKGTISAAAPLSGQTAFDAAQRILAQSAPGFYVNLRTTVNPNGALRGQLATFNAPPVISAASNYLLQTNTTNNTITLSGLGFDANSMAVINGQMAMASLEAESGQLSVTIPPALLSAEGALLVQVKNASGLLSAPVVIVVAAQSNINTQAASTTSAASLTAPVAPESIAAVFGTKLASQTASATGLPLPTSLDGTTVYVNGVAAPLFFVSPTQINYLIPSDVQPGMARVIVIAKDGMVSQGQALITATAPGLFTRRANGQGAPAAVASADGVNFNTNISNPDGAPVAIDAGSFVALFGTGLHFNSGGATLMLGSTNIPALFAGPQGQLIGLDQINFQIPNSLAGRGDVELIVAVDGKVTNAVRLKIK